MTKTQRWKVIRAVLLILDKEKIHTNEFGWVVDYDILVNEVKKLEKEEEIK